MIEVLKSPTNRFMQYNMKDFIRKGWYKMETRGSKTWVWSKKEASICLPQDSAGFSFYFYSGATDKRIALYDETRGLIANYVVKSLGTKVDILPPTRDIKIVVLDPCRPSRIDTRLLGVMLQAIKPLEMYRETTKLLPSVFWIEPTRLCNMNPPCVMCDSIPGEPRISNDILSKIKPYLKDAQRVYFHGKGEPLLCKSLFDILDNVDQKKTHTMFSTNGLFLTDRISRRLISKGLSEIHFSIDAATAGTYAKIRRRGAFTKLKKNIEQLAMIKKEKNIGYPRILLSIVLMKVNVKELTQFVVLADKLGAETVCLSLLNPIFNNYVIKKQGFSFNYKQQMIDSSSEEFKNSIIQAQRKAMDLGIEFRGDNIEIKRLLQEGSNEERESSGKDAFLSIYEPLCKKPWTEAIIDIDGSVRICCHIYAKGDVKNIKLGDLNKQGFEEMWNSPLARKLRRYLMNHILPPECWACPYNDAHKH